MESFIFNRPEKYFEVRISCCKTLYTKLSNSPLPLKKKIVKNHIFKEILQDWKWKHGLVCSAVGVSEHFFWTPLTYEILKIVWNYTNNYSYSPNTFFGWMHSVPLFSWYIIMMNRFKIQLFLFISYILSYFLSTCNEDHSIIIKIRSFINKSLYQ